MTTYIQPGRTVHLHGTLAATDRLVALYANANYGGPSQGAVLLIEHAATNDGVVLLEGAVSGSHYSPDASATLQNDGVLTNNGTIQVNGAAFYGPKPPGPGALLLNNGVLLNNGAIDLGRQSGPYYAGGTPIPGLLEDNGYMHNAGVVLIDAFFAGYYNFHGSSSGQLDVNGVLVNDGQLLAAGGNVGYGGLGSTIDVAGTLTNHADGIITGDFGGGGWTLDVAASGTLDNQGMLIAPFSENIGTRLDIAGVLHNSGTLALQYGTGSYDGQTGGAVLTLTGTMDNTGEVLVDTMGGNGDYNFGGGSATLNDAGVLANAGTITVYGGTEHIYASFRNVLTPPGLLLDSGTLTNLANGVIALQGGQAAYPTPAGATLDVTGALTNDGLIQLGAGIAAAGVGSGSGAVLLDTGTLRNEGSIALQGGGPYAAAAQLIVAGQFINDGLLSVAAGTGGTGGHGLTITATGTLTDPGVIAGGGSLLNDGMLSSGGSAEPAGLIDVATLQNQGTIATAAAGALTIDSAVTGTGGTFDIRAGSTLTFQSAVTATQTIVFQADAGTLAIGNAPSFSAVLDLEQRNLTLDFLSRHVTSATTTGTTLHIGFGNGNTLDYTLSAPTTPGTSIALASDGKGGTDVVFRHPAPAPAFAGGYATDGKPQFPAASISLTIHPA